MRPKRENKTVSKVILIIPGLVSSEPGVDILRESGSPFQHLVAESNVFRLHDLPSFKPTELNYFGVNPEKFQIAQGPITNSAFKHNPPADSIEFHLSVASVSPQGIFQPNNLPATDAELHHLKAAFKRLESNSLVPLFCEGLDHSLVWLRGSPDHSCMDNAETIGKEVTVCMPQGEGDVLLSRFIDDSVNLLMDADFNKRRHDEGHTALNILWPWGGGFRPQLPNLALHRGELVRCQSNNLQFEGLARLFGYFHSPRAKFGSRLKVDYEFLQQEVAESNSSAILIENVREAAKLGRWEEAAYFWSDIQTCLIVLLAQKKELRITFLTWDHQSKHGLGFKFEPESKRSNTVPLDQRIIDDSSIQIYHPWEVLRDEFRS